MLSRPRSGAVRVYGDAAVVTAVNRSTGRNNRTGEDVRTLGRYTEP